MRRVKKMRPRIIQHRPPACRRRRNPQPQKTQRRLRQQLHGLAALEARDLFAKLLLMINLDQELPGVRQYVMKKRGIFKTMVSRQLEVKFSPQQTAEIDFNLAALQLQ